MELDLSRYDGLDPFFKLNYLKDHLNYYDGTQILFLPSKEKRYDYVETFLVADPEHYIVVSDTLWNKNRTKIKEIKNVKIDVYKAEKINDKSVKIFGSDDPTGSGTLENKSGFSTPRTAIEGKVFTIKSCTAKKETRNSLTMYDFTIVMTDSEGVDIIWPMSYWMYNNNKQFMPIIMYPYYQKYEHYVGKVFVNTKYYKDGNIEWGERILHDVYMCTELSFVDDDTISDRYSIGHYYAPVLYFTHKGKEEHYNIIPKRDYGFGKSYSSIIQDTFDNLVEKDVFVAKLDAMKQERALKAQADSIAKAERAAQQELERKQTQAKQQKEKAERDARIQKEKEEQDALATQRKVERYAQLKSTYGEEDAKLMIDGKVKIGWTQQMCREAWGAPNDINKTITSSKVHEQWVYRKGYLYFDNGILTTIQN